MSDARDDERLSALIGEGGTHGLAMYGLYWRVNEIIAKQMKGEQPDCRVKYSVTRWSQLLSVRGSHLRHLLDHLSKYGLLTVEWDGADIQVTNRNLLKYRDEYSRKVGQHPDNVPPHAQTHTEAEGKNKPLPFVASHNGLPKSAPVDTAAAVRFFEELRIPADSGTCDVAAQAIRGLVKEKDGSTVEEALQYLLGRAREDMAQAISINRFWFMNQQYLPKKKPSSFGKLKFRN